MSYTGSAAMLAEIERLRAHNERLRAIIRDAIEAIERGSTSAPVLEALRSVLAVEHTK